MAVYLLLAENVASISLRLYRFLFVDGPVKSRLYTVQKKPDTGAVPLESFRTQCHKQCLDVIPQDAGFHRVMENGFQRLAVLAGHMKLVSLSDTFVNDFVGRAVSKPFHREMLMFCSPRDGNSFWAGMILE
jgi:hypothetical protein